MAEDGIQKLRPTRRNPRGGETGLNFSKLVCIEGVGKKKREKGFGVRPKVFCRTVSIEGRRRCQKTFATSAENWEKENQAGEPARTRA